MTPEERERNRAIRVAALGWQLRAERLEKENGELRERPTWSVLGVAVFAALMGWALAIAGAVLR